MNEIGFGLFNQEMIRKVKERWREGGIAVVYVSLRMPSSQMESAIHQWESGVRGLFWRQKLGHDYIYLLSRQPRELTIEQLSQNALERLRAALKKAYTNLVLKDEESDHAFGFRLGLSIGYPSVVGRSTETVIYRLLLEAIGQDETEGAAVTDAYDGLTGVYVPIGKLAAPISAFPSTALVSELAYFFDTNSKEQGAVIVKEGRPCGLLMKENLHALLAGQFGLPLYWNRSVERIMNDEPLIVDEAMAVEIVSQLAMGREFSHLYDVVIITKEGAVNGAASIRSILECMTALRTEEARTANPLTGLTGNVGIQAELHRRISAKRPFAILYADMDYFKWFNDCFGFAQGDELIRYTAEMLRSVVQELSGAGAFIGHIGGDDFIVLMETAAADALCERLIERFDEGVVSFYGGAKVTAVEDRNGQPVQQEGVTLSLSLLKWDGEMSVTPEDISLAAARLKKRTKAIKGSTYLSEELTGMHQREGR